MGENFADLRKRMVDGQLRTREVTDPRLIAAVLETPRERFVPGAMRGLAYADRDIDVSELGEEGAQRYLLEPMPLTRLIQLADIQESDFVLEIGSATGYATAILGRIAEGVLGLEADSGLASVAERELSELGIDSATIVTGPLNEGYASQAPYDVIVVNGAIARVPDAFVDQLREGGRLVAIIGGAPMGRAWLYHKVNGDLSGRPVFDAAVPDLPGFAREPDFVF
ncbi:MAG: protein-L-isoaspartate O-methyltransferase [Pseudomonadota bacterium]